MVEFYLVRDPVFKEREEKKKKLGKMKNACGGSGRQGLWKSGGMREDRRREREEGG
jgi:hypothetical protein